MQKKSCDIIIPVWNQPESTKECIDSIRRNTGYPHSLIVVDNGSSERTREYLTGLKKEMPGFNLIRNETNLGFVKAVNQGMHLSTSPYLCLMNNDTVATSGWLEEMVGVMDANPGAGIVNPSSNTFGQTEEYAASLSRFSLKTQELYSARGFCMLIKKEVIDTIGIFDESFSMGYFEETDFSYRARKAGFGIFRAKGAYVRHKENTSFKELDDNARIFDRNEKIFFERWGRPVHIGYFSSRSVNRAEDTAREAARAGYRIAVFHNAKSAPVSFDHINIRNVRSKTNFFMLESLYSVIRRMKKKKLDILVTDDKLFGGILSGIKFLHGAEVMVDPDIGGLLKLAESISKKV